MENSEPRYLGSYEEEHFERDSESGNSYFCAMKSIPIGTSDLSSTRLAYGCFRIAGTWDAAAVTPKDEVAGRAAVKAAYEAGYTSFDHADIYTAGVAERIFGQ